MPSYNALFELVWTLNTTVLHRHNTVMFLLSVQSDLADPRNRRQAEGPANVTFGQGLTFEQARDVALKKNYLTIGKICLRM